MRRLCGLTLVGGLILFSGSARPGEKDEARAIVMRAIKASGGETALKKHESMTWTEKGTYYGMGDGLPYTGKMAVQLPGQFRMEIEGVFVIVVDNDKAWMSAGGDTKPIEGEALARQQRNQKAGLISSLLPLTDKAFTLTVIDGAEVDKKPAVGIKVTRKDYPEVKLYFDKASGLLVKNQVKVFSDEEKKDVTQEQFFSKHKEIEGAKVPMHVVIKRDGKLFVETDIMDLKVGKLDAKTFAAPK
jgi:hypothetical protein